MIKLALNTQLLLATLKILMEPHQKFVEHQLSKGMVKINSPIEEVEKQTPLFAKEYLAYRIYLRAAIRLLRTR
jgi:hypothetical protein